MMTFLTPYSCSHKSVKKYIGIQSSPNTSQQKKERKEWNNTSSTVDLTRPATVSMPSVLCLRSGSTSV